MAVKQYIWSEFYRPKTIAECILPADIKKTFTDIVESGTMQNLLLTGTAGVGKTTVALALAEEMGYDALVINASLDNGIDILRSKVQQFASSRSLSGNPKVVIFDEADYLNANSIQPALRGFIQTFHNNCRFIFTCNYKNRIIEPIHSRLTEVNFKIVAKDKPVLAGQFFKRLIHILTTENIEFDKKVVAELVSKHFPDLRKVLNELQRYSVGGVIDSGILLNIDESSYKELVGYLKDKNFTEVRKWVAKNSDSTSTEILGTLYNMMSDVMEPQSIPQAVMIIADYSYKSAFVSNQEINTTASLVEIMAGVKFK
jgi:DNA polymerase III delta prime subunit